MELLQASLSVAETAARRDNSPDDVLVVSSTVACACALVGWRGSAGAEIAAAIGNLLVLVEKLYLGSLNILTVTDQDVICADIATIKTVMHKIER